MRQCMHLRAHTWGMPVRMGRPSSLHPGHPPGAWRLWPHPLPAHAPANLTARTRGVGVKMNQGKDFFITFLNILLIASSVADVVCLMMHRQEQPLIPK